MNGSSINVSLLDSGRKKRFNPTPSASEIFSRVPRLGVICPLSTRERYERDTRDRAWSWLWVMPRVSRNWRMRCPMFSTVCAFGQCSKSCRSSPGSSWAAGGGISYCARGGSIRRQRRQLSVFVRYCTSPHTLQRITSLSFSIPISGECVACDSDTCTSLLFPASGSEATLLGGRQKPARGQRMHRAPQRVKRNLRFCPQSAVSCPLLAAVIRCLPQTPEYCRHQPQDRK